MLLDRTDDEDGVTLPSSASHCKYIDFILLSRAAYSSWRSSVRLRRDRAGGVGGVAGAFGDAVLEVHSGVWKGCSDGWGW